MDETINEFLIPDIYPLIFSNLQWDWVSCVTWFWTCKRFAAMVSLPVQQYHRRPQVLSRDGSYWDGPMSRFAMFQGKQCVLWRTQHYESVRPWTPLVRTLIGNFEGGDWDEIHTREIEIIASLQWDAATQSFTAEREWEIYYKQQWTLYGPRPGVDVSYDLSNYKANKFESTSRILGIFMYEEIDWHGFGRHGQS